MTEKLEDMKRTVHCTAESIHPEIPVEILDDILDAESRSSEDFVTAKNKVREIVERYLDSMEG